jgi:hypothetical protein
VVSATRVVVGVVVQPARTNAALANARLRNNCDFEFENIGVSFVIFSDDLEKSSVGQTSSVK